MKLKRRFTSPLQHVALTPKCITWYVPCSLGWIKDGEQPAEVQLLVFILTICLHGIKCEYRIYSPISQAIFATN